MKPLAILFLVSLLSAFSGLPASAQQVQQNCAGNTICPPQTTDRTATLTAPHRQPTMNDLTPQLRQAETTGSAAPDPLGPLPDICRHC